MTITKYIKQPLSTNLANYSDAEFRKIETALSALLQSIEDLEAMNIETGSFVVTLTGVTAVVTTTARYIKIDNLVHIFIPAISGTSNTTACTLTGTPSNLRPAVGQGKQWLLARDNGAAQHGSAVMETTGVITLRPGNFIATGWTAAGMKGVDEFNLTYLI